MTIEEKAKAYDKALSKAREYHFQGQASDKLAELESIFPELRESEDERIREAIEAAIRVYGKTQGEWIGGYDMDTLVVRLREAFGVLEKQKDANKAIEVVERIDKYIDEHLTNAHDMKDSNPDKKYYRGWDDALGKMSGILQDVYSDEKQKERKSTEDVIKKITQNKETATKFLKSAGIMDENGELAEIYRSEQKPSEWSEEDERMRNQLIYDVEHHKKEGLISAKQNKATKTLYNEIEKCYDEKIAWLKSLRPQPHWKPSEEQMEWLESAVKLSTDKPHIHGIIISLYEQLKRL